MVDFLIDDRGIIPEDIRNMTKEELDAEISRLEKKATLARQKSMRKQAIMNTAV